MSTTLYNVLSKNIECLSSLNKKHDRYDEELSSILSSINELSGTQFDFGSVEYASISYVNTQLSSKQNIIDSTHKLDYSLLSNTPTVPTKTSDLTNDSGFITNTSLSSKQDKITSTSKLAYSLISGAPTVPTKTSDLTNDSGYATSSYVQAQVSGKQNIIDSTHKLDYSLLSNTPTIPTKTSDLTNDSGYATTGYVSTAINDAFTALPTYVTDDDLEDIWLPQYQKKITSTSKLAYSLISGAPAVPTKTTDLTNDSGYATSSYVQAQVSGKQNALTFDSTPTSGSSNPVTSDGIHQALQLIQEAIDTKAEIDSYEYINVSSATTRTLQAGYSYFINLASDLTLSLSGIGQDETANTVLLIKNPGTGSLTGGNITLVDELSDQGVILCQVVSYSDPLHTDPDVHKFFVVTEL